MPAIDLLPGLNRVHSDLGNRPCPTCGARFRVEAHGDRFRLGRACGCDPAAIVLACGWPPDLFDLAPPVTRPDPDDAVLAEVAAEQAGVIGAPVRLADVAPQPLAYAVEPLVLAREINAVVGETGAMKTTLLLHILAAMTVGADVFGALPVRTPGPVLFLSGEDDRSVIANRVRAICAGHGWDAAAVLARFHLWDEGVALDDPRWERRIIEACRDLCVVHVGADPLRDVAGATINENDNSDAAKVNAVERRIIAATGATVTWLGHVSKPSEGKERRHRVRGASAWLNATRLAWWAEPGEGGVSLLPIKGNRSGRLAPLRIKVVVNTPDGLNWQAARFDLDREGDVTGRDVVRVLQIVGSAATPPTTRAVRDLLRGEGFGNDRADAALAEARGRGWVAWTEGARGAHLHSLSEAGHARLLLAGGNDRA
jgi:hypothetical protein